MSTRCGIGLLRPNGTVLAIYCHNDGYPDGVGACLINDYKTEERIKALLELGSTSGIGKYLSKEEAKKDVGDKSWDVCDPYCIGPNLETTRIIVFPDKDEYKNKAKDYFEAEYIYLFEEENWNVYPLYSDSPHWYDLAEVLKKGEPD